MKDPIRHNFEEISIRLLSGEMEPGDSARLNKILDAREDLKEDFEEYRKINDLLEEVLNSSDLSEVWDDPENRSQFVPEREARESVNRLSKKYPISPRAASPFHRKSKSENPVGGSIASKAKSSATLLFSAMAAMILASLGAGFFFFEKPMDFAVGSGSVRDFSMDRLEYAQSKNCTGIPIDSQRSGVPWDATIGSSMEPSGCLIHLGPIEIALNSHAAIRFRKKENGIMLTVLGGSVYIQSEKLKQDFHFSIYTGGGLIQLLGTSLAVHKDQNRNTIVEVADGAVQFQRDLIRMSEEGALLEEDIASRLVEQFQDSLSPQSEIIGSGSALAVPPIDDRLISISRDFVLGTVKNQDQGKKGDEQAFPKSLLLAIQEKNGIGSLAQLPELGRLEPISEDRMEVYLALFQQMKSGRHIPEDQKSHPTKLALPGITIPEPLAEAPESTGRPNNKNDDRTASETTVSNGDGASSFIQRVVLFDGTSYMGLVWEENEIYHIKDGNQIHKVPAKRVRFVEMINE